MNDDPDKPPTPIQIIRLEVYLAVVTLIVIFGIYTLWARCGPCESMPQQVASGAQAGAKGQAPEIFLTPQSGPIEGETLVRIIGSGFENPTPVSFGPEQAEFVKFESATSIVVKAPAHAPGKVDVIVKKKPDKPDAVGNYWYLAAAPPSVTTVTPNSGFVTGKTSVNIIGTGFVKEAKVSFGGTQSKTVAVDSATSITASLPAHLAGKVDVVVANGDGQVTIKGDAFTYKCPGLPEDHMLLMIVCVGALGGSLHAMRSLADFVGSRQLKVSWIPFYILLPFNSAMIALVFYLIIRAGLYSPESATEDTTAIMLGLAVLVGMFSEAAIEKLKKIAAALLTEPQQRTDKIGTDKIEKVPDLDLHGLSPLKGSTRGGDSVKLEGRGFSDNAEVTFDRRKAEVVSRTGDASITVKTPEHAAGPVDVEVLNPGDKKSKLSGGFAYEATEEQPIVVTPDKVDFGEHTIGKKPPPRETVTLTNRSGAAVNVSRIDTSGDFALIAPSGQTFPFAIAAGSTFKLDVEFTPKTEGGCSGNITVTDDGVGSPRVIALAGKGSKAPTE